MGKANFVFCWKENSLTQSTYISLVDFVNDLSASSTPESSEVVRDIVMSSINSEGVYINVDANSQQDVPLVCFIKPEDPNADEEGVYKVVKVRRFYKEIWRVLESYMTL